MSDFTPAFVEVIGLEGGYVYNPADPGGETKYGIAKRWHPTWDIRNLTLADAKGIYKEDYWVPMRLGELTSQDIATELFEQGVNMGRMRAVLHVQQAYNLLRMVSEGAVIADSMIGPNTIKAVNRLTVARVIPAIKLLNFFQLQKYMEIIAGDPSQKQFFVGWLRRIG